MKKNFFDSDLFKKSPALAALKDIDEPKPETLRACILELARYIVALEDSNGERLKSRS